MQTPITCPLVYVQGHYSGQPENYGELCKSQLRLTLPAMQKSIGESTKKTVIKQSQTAVSSKAIAPLT